MAFFSSLLGVSGSPRRGGSTSKAVLAALEAAASVAPADTVLYEFAGKRIKACNDCRQCAETGRCALKDDFEEFDELYRQADAVIWGAPVYLMSVPATLKAACERLINPELSFCMTNEAALPRPLKACGVIAVGGHRNGGTELTLMQLVIVCLLNRCVVVAGDIADGAYIGASLWSRDDQDSPSFDTSRADTSDDIGFACARGVGRRVTEMAMIIRGGKAAILGQLPAEYSSAGIAAMAEQGAPRSPD